MDRAQTDLSRALILQNNRTARRFDVMGRHRTEENEARLFSLARKLVMAGFVLSALLAVLDREVGWLMLVFLLLYLLFRVLVPLRQRAIDALDGVLIRRAARFIARVRLPAQMRIRIEGSSIRGENIAPEGDGRTWSRDLGSCRYALAGAVSLMLFTSKRGLNPMIVLFVPEALERDRLRTALTERGYEVETLSRELLPSGVLVRRWP
ncbi:MAG: hypothetical protein IT384_26685 [Deltaproteobacteria bacterium]|nr:hypothetical protein [Deltaproteobacteria bacterium]